MQADSLEIIPDKLFWVSDRVPPRNQPNSLYFCIDTQLIYQPFCSDFGPLNISSTYKFCIELQKLLQNKAYQRYKIFHYCSVVPSRRANAACLMGCFQILILGRTANQAWAPFSQLAPFQHYRDAGYGVCTYQCTIPHILKGLERAVKLNWFNLNTFDVQSYDFYEKVQNGDWNWIIPGKLLALACPASTATDAQGYRVWTPEDYSPVFKELGITAVIRLNNKTYSESRFLRHGLKHYDLFFVDGSCPQQRIIKDFLAIVQREAGVAVHCKAGLGRTGTLIGCYAMKHFGFPAEEFIGWARLMRPGSVLGPQQQFLKQIQQKCRAWKFQRTIQQIKEEPMSPQEKRIRVNGDHGQAERLMQAKKSNQQSPFNPNRSLYNRSNSLQTPSPSIKRKRPVTPVYKRQVRRNK